MITDLFCRNVLHPVCFSDLCLQNISFYLNSIWVTLGADFDNSLNTNVNQGFRGYVSQLNVYNRALDFENEMPRLLTEPRRIFSGTILRWNEFIYHRGVQPVYPSSAQKQCTGSNCVTNCKFLLFRGFFFLGGGSCIGENLYDKI
jgi:hypothetical protein